MDAPTYLDEIASHAYKQVLRKNPDETTRSILSVLLMSLTNIKSDQELIGRLTQVLTALSVNVVEAKKASKKQETIITRLKRKIHKAETAFAANKGAISETERDDLIIKEYLDGITIKEIALKWGVSISWVRALAMKHRKRQYTAEFRKKIR